MSKPVFSTQIYCPFCKKNIQLIRINTAASLAAVSRRTLYRYIEEGSIHTVKIAGKTLRVCASCLLGRESQKAS